MNLIKDQAQLLKEVHDFYKAGTVRGVIVDRNSETSEIRQVFPIFKKDTEQDVVDRYRKLFPNEANAYLASITDNIHNLNHEKGMSRQGTMRFAMSIPPILYRAMVIFDPDVYWKDRESFRRFAILCPKFVRGSV